MAKQAIVFRVDRKSGYAVLAKVKSRQSGLKGHHRSTEPACKEGQNSDLRQRNNVRRLASIDQSLGEIIYFNDPYSIWQRGSNENLTGLISQYISKF
jgi:IS30 family transposase